MHVISKPKVWRWAYDHERSPNHIQSHVVRTSGRKWPVSPYQRIKSYYACESCTILRGRKKKENIDQNIIKLFASSSYLKSEETWTSTDDCGAWWRAHEHTHIARYEAGWCSCLKFGPIPLSTIRRVYHEVKLEEWDSDEPVVDMVYDPERAHHKHGASEIDTDGMRVGAWWRRRGRMKK